MEKEVEIELLFNFILNELVPNLKEGSLIGRCTSSKLINELFDEVVQLKPGYSAIDEFAPFAKRIGRFLKLFSELFVNNVSILLRDSRLLDYRLASQTSSLKMFSSYDLKSLSQIMSKLSRCPVYNGYAENIASKVAAIMVYKNFLIQKKRLQSLILVRIHIVFILY